MEAAADLWLATGEDVVAPSSSESEAEGFDKKDEDEAEHSERVEPKFESFQNLKVDSSS